MGVTGHNVHSCSNSKEFISWFLSFSIHSHLRRRTPPWCRIFKPSHCLVYHRPGPALSAAPLRCERLCFHIRYVFRPCRYCLFVWYRTYFPMFLKVRCVFDCYRYFWSDSFRPQSFLDVTLPMFFQCQQTHQVLVSYFTCKCSPHCHIAHCGLIPQFNLPCRQPRQLSLWLSR